MKKIALIITLFTLGLVGLQESKATHIQGMNITYVSVGNSCYVFTMDFFRYCGGTAFNNGNCTGAAGIGTSAGFMLYCEDFNTSWNVTAQADTIKEATPICDSLNATQNSCLVGSCGLLGIQWGVYTSDTICFDSTTTWGQAGCDNWTFVYASGARNTGVNYVSQPSIVAYDRLQMASFPNNSSVQFNSNKPIPFFCDGQEVTYNWSAYDPDGDSLWWELDTAWNSFSGGNYSSITYQGGYSGPQPMPGTTTINNLTGQLNFTATIPVGFNFANYAIAVTVKEYNNQTGVYKGEVHRDIQFIVLDSCDNTPPVDEGGITNFEGEGGLLDSNSIVVCIGQDFEFDLIFADYDTSGNISSDSITSFCNIDQILPGAIWTTTGTNPDTVHISWIAVPTNQTYVPFNVTVEDNFCPVTGFNIYSYVVRIEPSTYLGPDTAICELDTIQLDAHGGDTFWWSTLSGDPIQVGTNFGCSICADPWIHPSQTTIYVVQSNLEEACGNSDTIVVEVFNKFPVDITPDVGGTADLLVYCSTDPLDTLIPQTPGGTFIGSGIVNAIDGVFAPDILDPGSGNDTTVTIIYILEGVCANSDTLDIRVKGAPDASIATLGPYCEQLTSVQLLGNFTITNTQFQTESWWDTGNSGNPTAVGILNPSSFTAPDTVMVHHLVNDSGCVNEDSTAIHIVGEYNSAIDSLPKICEGEEVLIYLNTYEGDPFGIWEGSKVTETPEGSGNYYFSTTGLGAGSYDITYKIEGACGTETTEPLIISKLPDARIFGADSVYCDNIIDSVQLGSVVKGGIWGGSMNQLHDGYFIPSKVGEGVYTISYELYDTATTCYNKNILPVRIARTPVAPKVWGGGPYCQGTQLNNLRGDGLLSNTFKWYAWDEDDRKAALAINPDTIPNLSDFILLGAGNPYNYGELIDMPTRVFGTQMSKFGCESPYSEVVITVLPSPVAKFGTKDSIVVGTVPMEVQFINASTIGSDTSGIPLTYEWTFGPFGNSVEVNPIFTFEQIGNYTVTLVADNSVCQDSHDINIRLDRLTSFFIPNVFSPNGDLINDEFDWTISGIDEFRLVIYNRWGTKVFETENIDDVWDGGKEPDGTYYYVMTGKEMTLDQEDVEYRGDLTLIRD